MIAPRQPNRISPLRYRDGITLLELLVALAILAILIGLLVPALQRIRDAAATTQCRNNLRNLGLACHSFLDTQKYFPRNTVRPRGTTPLNGQPIGTDDPWDSGSFESWLRELTPFVEQGSARAQDAIPLFGCPADPRGITSTGGEYGFTWYVGVFSSAAYFNDGIILDDSALPTPLRINSSAVTDGASNTIMIAERPPGADGQWGWWDTPVHSLDTISAAKGRAYPYSWGLNGACPDPTIYKFGNYLDPCAFNAVWSCHRQGANFCMGDGSIRTISYAVGTPSVGSITLLEALATRSGGEATPLDF